MNAQTPEQYSRALAVYIRDPSTIRVRCLEQFARAPSVEQCAKMIATHKATTIIGTRTGPKPATKFRCGHSRDENNTITTLAGQVHCRFCRAAAQAEADRRYRAKTEERAAAARTAHLVKHINDERIAKIKNCKFFSKRIIYAAETIFKTPHVDFLGPIRAQRYAEIRNAIAVIARERGFSYPQVAALIGRADHTTAINAVKRGAEQYGKDADYRRRFDALRKMANG